MEGKSPVGVSGKGISGAGNSQCKSLRRGWRRLERWEQSRAELRCGFHQTVPRSGILKPERRAEGGRAGSREGGCCGQGAAARVGGGWREPVLFCVGF